MPRRLPPRLVYLWPCLAILPALLLGVGCETGGHFTVLGYTTQPNYDCDIRTVHVPIFKNTTFSRGLEFDLTRAVIREIESKTPYKTLSSRERADTELLGKIVATRKGIVLFNQLGEVREAEALMGVELMWIDLRPGSAGQILSADSRPVDHAAPPGALVEPAPPVLVQPQASFIPELGGSLTTAQKSLVDRTAVQIVSLMEKGF